MTRTTLDLGRRADDNTRVRLSVDVGTETTAIFGRRGTGKTNTGKVLAEGLLTAGHQVVVIDPLDVWWGLKTGANGDPDQGHPILVVGDDRKPHTDLPLRPIDGKAIADLVVDECIPVVLSLRHLSKAKAKQFAADFAERIYERKGDPEHGTACAFFIDEASTLIPQRLPPGDIHAARALGAFESWVRQGRSSGIGCVLIDQRPASVNKDVLTQAEVLICHQLTHKLDRKALDEWVEANDPNDHRAAFMASLASLQKGEAWLWSPAWLEVFERVNIDLAATFDSSRTPRAGDATRVPTDLATLDLDAVRDRLAEAVEEADNNNPAKLRERITRLERDLRQASTVASEDQEAEIAAGVERGRDAGYANGLADGYSQGVSDARHLVGEQLQSAQTAVMDELTRRIRATPPKPATPAATSPAPAPKKTPSAPASPRLVSPPPDEAPDGFAPRHRKVLDALVQLEAMKVRDPQRGVVAAMAGTSPNSSGYEKTLGNLKAWELVVYPSGGRVALTDEGRALTQPVEQAKTLADYHAAWLRCKLLAPRHRETLESVIARYPDPLSRDELAGLVRTSPTSSGYEKTLGNLRSWGLIDYPRAGHVGATTLLFPEGLR